MRKTFQLRPEGKHPDRHLEAVKHEIRKYIQREKRRDLPKDMDYWAFDCRFGTDAESAQAIHVEEITASIDAVVKAEGPQFYIEILARAAKRGPRGERKVVEKPADSADSAEPGEADAED
jgi:hypothetical protein